MLAQIIDVNTTLYQKTNEPIFIKQSFEAAEANKAILLLDETRGRNDKSFLNLPQEIYDEERKLIKIRDKIQAKLLEKRTSIEHDSLLLLLNEKNIRLNSLHKSIQDTYPRYKNQMNVVNLEEIQNSIEDKVAILEYVLTDSLSYVIYLDNKSIEIYNISVSKSELSKRIADYHHYLSDYEFLAKKKALSYNLYTQNAYWFYKLLLAPVLENKKGVEHLIIIPDGEFSHLPFESFLVEVAPVNEKEYKNLQYLINDYKVSYNYSATLWKENKANLKKKNNGRMLGIASNYEILLDSLLEDVRLPIYQRLRDGLSYLPGARKEVESLEGELQGFFVFDRIASEKVFKDEANKYAIIHLAMHGLLDNREPIMSSLVFTEDSDSNQNNFLHAYEISKMELNADLVVLSACETGYGKFERGNGVASLARAFMYAGASSLIVSLWQVNDHATSVIMKKLYHNLGDGMDKAEALRQAKLEYIKSANGIMGHPAFWSPFIQMGDSAPISISKKGGILPWIIGGGALLLVILIGLIMRRRKEVV